MPDSMVIPSDQQPNVVDRVAQSADKALDATRRATDSLLDSVSGKVEHVRSTISPALNRVVAPWDAVTDYTREQPVKALAMAALVGVLMGRILGSSRRPRR